VGVYDYLSALASGASTASVAADNITAGSDVLATNFNGYDATMTNLSGVASALDASNNLLEAGHRVVTTVQKNALTGVATGTMVYDSTLGVFQVWNGSVWTFPTKRVGVKVHRTSSQPMTSEVSWNTAEWDTDPAGAMWSAASPSLITVKTAGLYNVTFSGSWQTTGGTITNALFYINQNYNTVRAMTLPNAAEGSWTITAQLSAAVNDTFMFSGAVVGGIGVTYRGAVLEGYTRTTAVLTLLGT